MKKTLIALAFALAALPFAGDAAAKGFADYHTETLKLPCTTCHATKDEMPTTDTCIKCHPKDKLVASTKNVKPTNPHTSPHYNADLDCMSVTSPARITARSAITLTSKCLNRGKRFEC